MYDGIRTWVVGRECGWGCGLWYAGVDVDVDVDADDVMLMLECWCVWWYAYGGMLMWICMVGC